MTKEQLQRAKGEIALARKDAAFTEAFIIISAAKLEAAWRKQKASLAKRSEVTRREIREFCSAL